MGKTLYLEGRSGISGDMTVAALLDLGGSWEKLENALQSLGVEGFRIETGRRKSCGIDGTFFDVILDEEAHHHDHEHHHHHHGHDHDHAHHHHHDHDHEHEHGHCHCHHEHDHEHCHHEHSHDHHHHEHRNFADVCEIINRGTMSDRARTLAKKIFAIIADAESIAHGIPVEEVHFHEVGAIDSIADIVGAAVLIDDLDITSCVVDGISEGQGMVKCQHGMIPVPVPAVVNIARRWQIPLRSTGVDGEMVTPTGIAIAAALRTSTQLPREYTIQQIGIGTGKKVFPHANILRAMLIDENAASDTVYMLEANIDDATGEELGLAMEKLLEAGVLDVHYVPCFMKKNRPGYILGVLVQADKLEKTEEVIFQYTSTIGIRKRALERDCMERESKEVETPYGTVSVKHCRWKEIEKFYPEYESVKAAAERSNAGFRTVFMSALQEACK